MVVKFNKKQIKALASIHALAESYFNEYQAKRPDLYKDADRSNIILCFEHGILKNIIESGEFFL